MPRNILVIASALALVAGCGGNSLASDAGRLDGGAREAGPPNDAGPPHDVGPIPDGSPRDGGACAVSAPPIDPSRVTRWQPGILSDEQLHLPLGADGLPQRTTVCATLAPGGNIQSALDACPEGQVVQLMAGTFHVSSTITLTRGVVLRGMGPSATTIVRSGSGSVLAIGTGQDSTCYGGTAHRLMADGAKESTTLSVGSAASQFSVGQLAIVDEVDDPTVDQGDCNYFKRTSGRSVSQRVEVAAVDVASGTLTLSAPLHWHFRAAAPQSAEITPVTEPTIRWAGIEHLRVQGGTNPGYNGQMAGGIDISNAAYSWVTDVETDETIGGMHVSLTGTYRVVVRDGNFHHSADYGFAHDCYGIVLRCGTAENLVENNIVRYMNKPILFNVTGGGNVVGYNYVDNSWASPPEWQEVNIDCHCAFPHMELIEGNYAPHVGATATHGNAGYLTFFRNYCSSQFAAPAVAGFSGTQNGNLEAVQFQSPDIAMNLVGNVLGAAHTTAYETYDDSNTVSIYSLSRADDVATSSLYRSGNFDTVHHATIWDPADTAHALPSSLYYGCRPGWWPADHAWPWVGPDLSPMVGALPAFERAQ